MADRPVLLRIPFSHFCRKAEWGLTQAAIEYDTLDVKLWQMKHARRANPREGTVPVLRTGDTIVAGSHNILVWAEANKAPDALPLYPQKVAVLVALWEAWADESVGPVTRREAYRQLYDDPRSFRKYQDLRWWMTLPPARRIYLGVLKNYKARRFDESDPPAVRAIIAKVFERLGKAGTDYLYVDYPTAADYATAALLEPLLPLAVARGYDLEPGWGEVEDFIKRVKPVATTRHRRHRVRERHWREFDRLNIGH